MYVFKPYFYILKDLQNKVIKDILRWHILTQNYATFEFEVRYNVIITCGYKVISILLPPTFLNGLVSNQIPEQTQIL